MKGQLFSKGTVRVIAQIYPILWSLCSEEHGKFSRIFTSYQNHKFYNKIKTIQPHCHWFLKTVPNLSLQLLLLSVSLTVKQELLFVWGEAAVQLNKK